ncbi:AGC/NDR protein kinase [Apiospora rasikravindrae]|uniref:non-specific serine/threonine protein kinase n=1 Tax=Apiospora rasikravindrae TaxID=990691 RepID=A0ABR1UB13_9PEZI
MRKHARNALEDDSTATDPAEPLLNWRNRCGNRQSARSVVGTSQYMAPEVIQEGEYDARCDWWSLGIILYECIYGHTPFLSEEGGRQETKRNIVNHERTFAFPPRPVVSRRCMDLMAGLIREKESRLCSKRYHARDSQSFPIQTFRSSRRQSNRDWNGRSVHPHDAEDIKAHKWFRGIPWDRLHMVQPPFVPEISGLEDTHYFDEEEPISDWSESQPDTDSCSFPPDAGLGIGDGTAPIAEHDTVRLLNGLTASIPMIPHPVNSNAPPLAVVSTRCPRRLEAVQKQLAVYPKVVRNMMMCFVETPYDSARLKRIDREIETLTANPQEVEQLKKVVRTYGRKERKRPRDRLLRDRHTKAMVLEARKQSAFLGYTWKRRGSNVLGDAQNNAVDGMVGVVGNMELDGSPAAAWPPRRTRL